MLQRGHCSFIPDIPHQAGTRFSQEALPEPVSVEVPELPKNCIRDIPLPDIALKNQNLGCIQSQGCVLSTQCGTLIHL